MTASALVAVLALQLSPVCECASAAAGGGGGGGTRTPGPRPAPGLQPYAAAAATDPLLCPSCEPMLQQAPGRFEVD